MVGIGPDPQRQVLNLGDEVALVGVEGLIVITITWKPEQLNIRLDYPIQLC